MRTWTTGIWGLISAVALAAQSPIDLSKLDRDMVGPRAQVLVVGTVHLRFMPKTFDPAALEGVLKKLEAFKPDIITIEAQSGEECDFVRRYPDKYGSGYNCADTTAARAATGLDIPAAIAEVEKALQAWPAQPTPAQRRHLAALFLAAAAPASAYVQWLQLSAVERRAGDGLDAALVSQLVALETRNSEDLQIAARLAARLGLQRVHATDNHTGDLVQVADDAAFGKALQAAWDSKNAELKAHEQQVAALKQAPDLLPLYRFINDPKQMGTDGWSGAGPALRDASPERYPQMWAAGWEIRNLRMVANIRETFRERPGARVLSLVGSAHKPWFDAWLGRLPGLDIVNALAVLK